MLFVLEQEALDMLRFNVRGAEICRWRKKKKEEEKKSNNAGNGAILSC